MIRPILALAVFAPAGAVALATTDATGTAGSPLAQGDGYRLAPVLQYGQSVNKRNRDKVPTKYVTIRKAFTGSVLPPK